MNARHGSAEIHSEEAEILSFSVRGFLGIYGVGRHGVLGVHL